MDTVQTKPLERETATISRRQAWARLLVAMVDEELPDPTEISFPSGDAIWLQLETADALAAWAEHVGARVHEPHRDARDGRWSHSATTSHGSRGWNGWWVSLTAYVAGEPEPVPVDEDLTAVRALATNDIARGLGEVAGPESDPGPATAAEGSAG